MGRKLLKPLLRFVGFVKTCYTTYIFSLHRLEDNGKSVYLHRVFHSIRFKVNKGWSTAVLLFLCPYVKNKKAVR